MNRSRSRRSKRSRSAELSSRLRRRVPRRTPPPRRRTPQAPPPRRQAPKILRPRPLSQPSAEPELAPLTPPRRCRDPPHPSLTPAPRLPHHHRPVVLTPLFRGDVWKSALVRRPQMRILDVLLAELSRPPAPCTVDELLQVRRLIGSHRTAPCLLLRRRAAIEQPALVVLHPRPGER